MRVKQPIEVRIRYAIVSIKDCNDTIERLTKEQTVEGISIEEIKFLEDRITYFRNEIGYNQRFIDKYTSK
jgi:hypothetical protein